MTEERFGFGKAGVWRLAESARDVIYHYHLFPKRGYEYLSPSVFAMTGHTAEEFHADPDLALRCVHPDDLHLLASNHRGPITDIPESVLLRWIHPDGRIVWAEHRRVLIFGDEGRIVAIEGVARDVTETVTIQDRLRESESQLRRLTAHLNTVREEERAHLARELHDELGQTLTGIKLELTGLLGSLPKAALNPSTIDRVQSIVGGIELATETVRDMATALRPPALDHLGLVAAVEFEAAAFSRRTGIRCRVVAGAPVMRLTHAQTTALFRILQEAMTNVGRHARASAITITVVETPAACTTTIQDNGRGIRHEELTDPAAIGLTGMRERAEQIGAALAITSPRGKGTTIVVTIPFESPEGVPASAGA